MNNTKLRFGAILLILSLVLVACGGSTEETVEEPAVEEAPAETLAAPATTSPPPEKLVIWAEEKIATALDPLVGAYESAAGVDVEVVIYDFGAIKMMCSQLDLLERDLTCLLVPTTWLVK